MLNSNRWRPFLPNRRAGAAGFRDTVTLPSHLSKSRFRITLPSHAFESRFRAAGRAVLSTGRDRDWASDSESGCPNPDHGGARRLASSEPHFRATLPRHRPASNTGCLARASCIKCVALIRYLPRAQAGVGGPLFIFRPAILCTMREPKPHRGDQAGSAHTVKSPAFPIPSGRKGLHYGLRL